MTKLYRLQSSNVSHSLKQSSVKLRNALRLSATGSALAVATLYSSVGHAALDTSSFLIQNGNASYNTATFETTLTPATNSQAGQAWSVDKIDIDSNFTIAFDVYLGTVDTTGADGIAFLFQASAAGSTATGFNGVGLGSGGIPNSLGIEFDTFQNGGDPTADHTSIYNPSTGTSTIQGTTTAGTAINTASAVTLPNLEDGAWHAVTITWNAATQTLVYTLDGVQRATLINNIKANFLGGNRYVHYGATASTGGFNNLHRIRFQTITANRLALVTATADTVSNVNGFAGATGVVNAFTGDKINKVAATATNSVLSVAPGSTVPAGLTFNTATGDVDVAAGTSAGTYSFDYQICDINNATNCKKATITVNVAAPISTLTNFSCQPSIYQVIAGGLNRFDPSTSVYSPIGTAGASYNALGYNPIDNYLYGVEGTTVIRVGADGSRETVTGLTVPSSNAGDVGDDGSYYLKINGTSYRKVDLVNKTDTTLTVTGAGQNVSDIVYYRSGGNQYLVGVLGPIVNIVALNAAGTSGNITQKTVAGLPAGTNGYGAIWTDVNGRIFASNNNTGDVYELFNILSATPTAKVVARGQVTNNNDGAACAAAPFPNLAPLPNNDSFNATAPGAPISGNVLDDNGSGVDFEPDGGTLTVNTTPAVAPTNGTLVLNADGTFEYTPNPGFSGIDTFTYEVRDPQGLVRTAVVTLNVPVSLVVATNDSATNVNGTSGATAVVNAFTSDTVNNVAASPANATLSLAPGVTLPAGISFNTATGNVDVAPGTPVGSYSFDYKICDKTVLTDCKIATITVEVVASPIVATADTATGINGATGNPTVLDLFAGDTINSAPASTANATLSVAPGSTVPSQLTFDPATGVVGVKPGTPAGTYTFEYQICETLNSANCKTATASVTVDASPIVATNDTATGINGATGGTAVANAFTSDTINTVAASPSNAVLTVKTGTTVPAGLTFNPATGSVDVAPGTPAGSYVIDYTICEILNPLNCKDAKITVEVVASPIVATADTAGPVPSIAGAANVVNALVNDSLNGVPVVLSQVALTVTRPASNPGVSLDTATGLVSVASNTPAGTYSIGYQICEILNPDNCATATVAVVVQAAAISAAPDAPAPVNGAVGGNDVINAFTNDVLNGAPVVPANITATVTTAASPATPGAPVPVLDPATGFVDVPAGTPAGTYTINYQICENLNPDNCASSSVTVVVQPPAIVAGTDTPAPVRQGIGNPNAINAFANDTLNGVPIVPANIIATVLTPAANPGVVLDPATGNVSVAADVPAGTYTIEYQICERLNPDNCTTAKVTVVVELPISAVEGTVYNDTNGDRIVDPNEPRRAGWIVEVVRNGTVVGTAITDTQGNYRIAGLTSGPGYDIVFRNPENNVVYDRIANVTLGANTTVLDQNQPIDPSGVFYNSVTRQPISGVSVRLTDANGVPLPAVCFLDASQANQTTGASGEYRFDLVPGAAPQCPLGETIYRIVGTPPAGYAPGSTVLLPQAGPFDPTGLPAPVRINPTATAPTAANPPFYLDLRLAAGDPDIVNNHIALDPFVSRTPLIVTKTSPKRSANIGDVVPYEITVRNTENVQRSGVEVVDILPPGMKYVMGTASVNGVAREPVKTDRQLSWTGQVIPANGSVRYNLTLVVGAGVTGGEKVNTGLAQNDADDVPISNRGTAVVTITPSAVFDCSELLGKVFEDANRNGYQDEGEPGVPGVRLATVNGQLISTDAFGRYHIACAAVPDARIGSNFVLKIDTRTLPLGWEVTTDNPRSIRLTRGKFGELNFGVAPKEDSSTSPRDTSTKRNEKGE